MLISSSHVAYLGVPVPAKLRFSCEKNKKKPFNVIKSNSKRRSPSTLMSRLQQQFNVQQTLFTPSIVHYSKVYCSSVTTMTVFGAFLSNKLYLILHSLLCSSRKSQRSFISFHDSKHYGIFCLRCVCAKPSTVCVAGTAKQGGKFAAAIN